MYRKLFVFFLSFISFQVFAQQGDPILMRVNDKKITRSQFEYVLNKEHQCNLKGKALRAYSEQYADKLLKVSAGESAGFDTTRLFRNKVISFRKNVMRAYLTNGQTDEDYARMMYDRLQVGNNLGEIQIVEIFKRLPQNASSFLIESTRQRMDSIYTALQKNPEKFQKFMSSYSDNKDTTWLSYMDKPADFEKRVFSLSVNSISTPFYSPLGISIVKVLNRHSVVPFESVKDKLIRLKGAGRDDKADLLASRLKNSMSFVQKDEAFKELREEGQTDKVLFILDGKPYSGSDFRLFADSHPMEIGAQIEAFTTKAILDHQYQKIEKNDSSLSWQVRMYRDDLLAREEDEIAAAQHPDSLALSGYFDRHHLEYKWDTPRFYGAVIYCVNNKIGKKVRKKMKKKSAEEWTDIVASFNKSGETVRLEYGTYPEGTNAAVDYFEYNTGSYTPQIGFPYTALVGEKKKYPESYKEVYDKLSSDYCRDMKQQWMEHLRVIGKVEISEEVLKTVNNHR